MFNMLAYVIAEQPLVCLLFVPVAIAVVATLFEMSPARDAEIE